MLRFIEIPGGLVVELTDTEQLLQMFPKLDVGLYEVMEYCDFAPEGTKNSDWDDISMTIGHAAIGYRIYDDGELCFDINVPYRMFGIKELGKDDILPQLVAEGELLFIPFKFRNQYGEEIDQCRDISDQ